MTSRTPNPQDLAWLVETAFNRSSAIARREQARVLRALLAEASHYLGVRLRRMTGRVGHLVHVS